MNSQAIRTNSLDILPTQIPYPAQSILSGEVSVSIDELLKEGFRHAQQGRYAEGAILFTLVREHLTPDLIYIAPALDSVIQNYAELRSAQQALQEVGASLVRAQTVLQTKIADLEELLLSPARVTNTLKANDAPTLRIPVSQGTGKDDNTLPELLITCFGQFEVKRLGQPVVLCTNRSGQAILRYLITRPGYRATKDKIIAALWSEENPEAALHRLRVAISALRRSLNREYEYDYGRGYILCKSEAYQLNPTLTIRTDVDEFRLCYIAGQSLTGSDAAIHYETACRLYRGPFLTEDLYADWSFAMREQLSHAYVKMCSALTEHYLLVGCREEAVKWAIATLNENPYDEATYRQLMYTYALQGCRDEALRQYQHCVQILAKELGTSPTPETVRLYQCILDNQDLLNHRT